MARQNINIGTTANDGTGDTLRVGADKINDNFIELYTFLGGNDSQITDAMALSADGLIYYGAANDTTLDFTEGSSDITITLPDTTGTVTLNEATQTLTNKTLTSAVLTTPQINDASSDHQYVFAGSELTADRTITLPLLTSNDEFVFKDHTQTLTNKTLTSPTLTTAKVTNHLVDNNGAEMAAFSPATSAVNHLELSNAAAGGEPQLAAVGDDTNVGLNIAAKGTGLIAFRTGVKYRTTNISSDSQAIDLTKPMTIFNAGGALPNITLADASESGHVVTLVNTGTGNVTITPTSFAAGTSFTLRQEGIVQVIWTGSEWHIMVGKLHSSSDTDALVYVTT